MRTLLNMRPAEIVSVFDSITTIPENLDIIKVRDIWELSRQGMGTTVAVIDTGVEINHPNLRNNIIGGCNFTDDDNGDPNIFKDYDGHGTHVSGIIAGSACENGKGMIGVAPKSKLLILKAINQYGVGSYGNLIKAINHAINWIGPKGEKVNVINMSLGGSIENENLHKIIKRARQHGIVLVSAAGNHGDGDPKTIERSFPAYYQEVIQVGSVTRDLVPSLFSSSNVNLDFVAPGENIISTHLKNKFVQLTGTSMAAPYVSGGAALLLNLLKNTCSTPVMLPHLVYQYFLDHVRKLDFSINQVGNGFIQLK